MKSTGKLPTPDELLQLRKRMVKHATSAGNRHPEDIASEYVVRLLEGLHTRATISQAYIDIMRTKTGRKITNGKCSEESYRSRQSLGMVASSEAQDNYVRTAPVIEELSLDERIDLKRMVQRIKCTRTQEMISLKLEGYVNSEIAAKFSLTESRVHQIIDREIERLYMLSQR